MNLLRILLLAASLSSSLASDWSNDGYGNDQGYYGSGGYDDSMGEYFDKGAAQPAENNLMKMAAGSAFGWFLGGKIHSKRTVTKLKKKHASERAAFVQLYREQVGALQEFNKESARIIQAMESSIIARQQGVPAEIDTVPFFMADTDGSKKISKAEFDRYVREYLANYPGLKPEDIPKWESFDHDRSGTITFDEYNQQMMKEIKKAQYRAAKNY
ncbi:predicted protein [Thalassiosira pseudonana CCMP1335]|uniref:EF-hand domain-containing protein n=1 Tax=Thalassiosira pseudonana TaxID=35128 RepID=B5YMV4_THAPS|nr:predicted protein [Thalassiosira pseudonana CCMP1335]ACI64877.1 predicted protein [Thalassiosira pseudonana CCMP1335]|mmetsp:Transcript_21684/g.47031  ORF Transcript_21684/g.47031 Transcript_21684/m.47031 type:complete len:214 (-) Transcript_21684:162-803(-)|eukprot:g6773.t1 g6773   contig23:1185568-1186307(+)